MKRITIVLILIFMASCATTAVNTNPQGARVYVNGEFCGVTPCSVNLGEWSSSALVRVELDGYGSKSLMVQKQVTHTMTRETAGAVAYNARGGIGVAHGHGTSHTTTETWPSQLFFDFTR